MRDLKKNSNNWENNLNIYIYEQLKLSHLFKYID